tara:strand:- start:282 stop:1265 length:984 start_codon:yes stop_codon:yes gene_type:complete
LAIRYTLIHQDATTLPTTAAQNLSNGINLPGGMIDELIVRITGTVTAADIAADFQNVFSQARFIINGVNVFDWRAGYGSAAQATPSQLGYMLNSMGAQRSTEVMGATAKEAFVRIPVGMMVGSNGVSRLEYTIGYYALATTSMVGAADASFEIYVRYNDNVQTQTVIGAATTFTASATQQQIVVRMPANVQGALAAVFIQNDSVAEDIDEIRLVSQSDYSLSVGMWRALNGDLGGVKYADQGNSAATAGMALSETQAVGGSYFLPTFNLSLDTDLFLQVTCNAATTLTFTPIVVAGTNGAGAPNQRQLQPVVVNTSAAILADSAAQS